jgi:hypothetical protein
MRRNRDDLSDEQCAALDEALRILAPVFPGEVVRLYCPKIPPEFRRRRLLKIHEGIAAGLPSNEIATRADCSESYVFKVRRDSRRAAAAA